MSVDHYTYRVTWSAEDGEHVGLCAEFPSLSWLARTPEAALKGIRRVVGEAVADMQASGEAIPVPLAEKNYSGEFRVDQARIRATRSARIMIVELSSRRAIDFSKSSDPMRYTNHSCRPNARLSTEHGRVEFYALRAIPPGEEITVDYGQTHHQGTLACRCGAAGCVGWL